MIPEDIHSCSLFCDRPECCTRQRDQLRDYILRTGGNDALSAALKLRDHLVAAKSNSQDIPDSCPDLLDSCMGSACERNDLVPGYDDLDVDSPL